MLHSRPIFLQDSILVSAGYGGALFSTNRLQGFSTVDISGYSGNVQLSDLTSQSTATLTGTGTISAVRAKSANIIYNGSLTGSTIENSSLLSSISCNLTSVSITGGSTVNILAGNGTHSILNLLQNSQLTNSGTGTMTRISLIDSNLTISVNSGNLTDVNVSSSTMELTDNSGDINDFSITDAAIVNIDGNTTNLSNWQIEGRQTDIGPGPYVLDTITEIGPFRSNVEVSKAIAANVITMVDTDNFVGIIEVSNTGTVNSLVAPGSWPDGGIIRLKPANGTTLTVGHTIASGAGLNDLIGEGASIMVKSHSATTSEFLEYRRNGNVWEQITTLISYL